MPATFTSPRCVALGVVALALVVTACGSDRAPIDAGPVPDRYIPRRDAAHDSAPSIDAPDASDDAGDPSDAAADDAGFDASRDVGVDAALPDGCMREICNRLDDDCDGRFDESGCGTCTSATRSGRVYLRCTGVDGFDVLGGDCTQRGRGYSTVVFEDLAEQLFVSSTLGGGFIGAFRGAGRAFETLGGQPFASDLLFASGFPAPEADQKRCAVLDDDNEIVDDVCSLERPVICEGPVEDGSCTPVDETCNGLDDDCDRRIDESETCPCQRVALFDHRYAACRGVLDERSIQHSCRTLGTGVDLATLETFDESIALSRAIAYEIVTEAYFVGHNDIMTEGRFVTFDGRELPLRWGLGQPADPTGENDCVGLVSGGFAASIPCAGNIYVCEFPPLTGP